MDMKITTITPDAAEGAADKARLLKRTASDGSSGVTEKQRQLAKKVSQDFEGLFVGMMMKSMRSTVGKDTLTGGGHGEEVYRSMLDQQYADASVKRGGGLGLAKLIEKDIIRQESRKTVRTVDTKE
jgi:peptidoglycan hydrolase FlgJ